MRDFKLKPTFRHWLGLGIVLTAQSVFAYTTPNGIMVMHDVKHDVSMPLKNVPLYSKRLGFIPTLSQRIKAETALTPLTAFQGVGVGLGSYMPSKPSSQVSGSVGVSQYVQWVDPDIGVFDKNTGAIADSFPKPGNAIWFGFGGPCETQNIGAPSVKHDHIASRWIFSREAYENIETGPFYQCIAVSTTEDATGSYYRYAFEMDSLTRYGSIGLWTDAYYSAFTMFGPVSEGPRACAFEKDKMLIGEPATSQCKQMSFAESGILRPATLAGRLEPTGFPGYFFSLSPPSSLLFFKFYVDWVNPGNSTLTNAISIPVNDFDKPCPTTSGSNCAAQPDTTTKLDVIGDIFTSRINFRQFPTHSSFVLTHNIQGPPPKLTPALRWYELRMVNDPEANPVVYQQQNYAPDSKARHTGAIGIDRYQNIALGYTVSSTAVHPSPEMGYRNYADVLNNLTTQPLVTGLGSQLNVSTWTNNASMTTDPTDGCTFWFTSQYLQTDGSFNWSTAIVHFKLDACA